jgi:hypothetical protein
MKCCSVYQFSKNGTNCKELTFVVDAALVSSEPRMTDAAFRTNGGLRFAQPPAKPNNRRYFSDDVDFILRGSAVQAASCFHVAMLPSGYKRG